MNSFLNNIQTRHNFILCNIDTDSISFCKPDMSEFSLEEMIQLLQELNSDLPTLVQFCDDGYFKNFIVAASKNYILQKLENGPIKIKGASLKATNKEIYLKDFIKGVINIMLDKNWTQDQIIDLYNKTALECINVQDITRYAFKKTITEAVLTGQGTAELKARLALKFEIGIQQGDKFRIFYLPNTNLCLDKNFKGEYCKKTLLKKLFATVRIFHNLIPTELFKNYSLQVNYYPFIGEEKPKRKATKPPAVIKKDPKVELKQEIIEDVISALRESIRDPYDD